MTTDFGQRLAALVSDPGLTADEVEAAKVGLLRLAAGLVSRAWLEHAEDLHREPVKRCRYCEREEREAWVSRVRERLVFAIAATEVGWAFHWRTMTRRGMWESDLAVIEGDMQAYADHGVRYYGAVLLGKAAQDARHRCGEACVCPLDGSPVHYSPFSGVHACQDPDCANATGAGRG